MEQLKQIIPYPAPVIIPQLIMQIRCTLILIKEETKVKFDKKWLWAVIIWLFQLRLLDLLYSSVSLLNTLPALLMNSAFQRLS